MSPKRFKYRLEVVLELRKRKEEQEQEKYLKLVNEVARLDQQIEEVRGEQHRVYRECELKMAENQAIEEWRRDLNYGSYLEDVARRLLVFRSERDKARLQQREVLMDASKKRKILESLKEKALQDFLLDLNVQEQRELDDWASTYFRP
jgi:flagellar protein FliJ